MRTFDCIRSCGVEPTVVHHIAVNNFVIAPNFSHCFKRYFLLYWSPQHLISQIEGGTIKDSDGNSYIVIYHNTSRGKLLRAPQGSQVALSFREPRAEFRLAAYVLVSFIE